MPAPTTYFALPDDRSPKVAPDLVGADDAHFAALDAALQHAVATAALRLDEVRRLPGGTGQEALDRDQEVHRLSTRLRVLRRHGVEMCLGRTTADDGETLYVGRVGVSDAEGRRLLVDWRTPAAEPFFAATHADPRGLGSRRRYRWAGGRVTDFWDEVLTPEALEAGGLALDDESAFVAGLGRSREPRMRDVLATIQADQDAVVRAPARGALVVDGGPGTGKTVVALHRAAYLLHADPHLAGGRGDVLVVGPHLAYLAYVADVLPSLGEEGVRTCTLRDLVPEGRDAVVETDDEVRRLKSDGRLLEAVEAAVRFYEEPPTTVVEVATPWGDVRIGRATWAQAFAAPDPGAPHAEARADVWDALTLAVADALRGEEAEGGPDLEAVGGVVRRDAGLREVVGGAWPLLEAAALVGDLWAVPAFLRHCAPWLAADEARVLRRPDPQRWTDADLPLLDAAHLRLGDPAAESRRRRREASVAVQREERTAVVDHLIAADDSDMMIMSMLRGADLTEALAASDDDAPHLVGPAALAGPFAHVVVDEAQELDDAQWQMVRRRCPSGSLTLVGDRAQARRGFTESWTDRLRRVGIDRVTVAGLSVNYRTPAEIVAAAASVVRQVLPDAGVPTSARSVPGSFERAVVPAPALLAEVRRRVEGWRDAAPEGTACVITHAAPPIGLADLAALVDELGPRVSTLTAPEVKGLEFDLVVLLESRAPDHPDAPDAPDVTAAVDRYVAMTRATQRLVVLEAR